MQLTKTLLMADFGLTIELPNDRLCPPIPNRHSYILWLKGLLDTTSYEPPGRKLYIDEKSLGYADKNVHANGLEDRIRVLERRPEDPLIPIEELGLESIDFVMTNPPFYTSEDEMLSSAREKERPPHSVCTGAPVEMVCEGGEVAHIGRMLQESLLLRERVQWYTAMLGKATSVEALVEKLRAHNIDNFAVTEFVQGNKTRRWALAWSFGPMRPTEDIARGTKASHWKKLLPPPSRILLHTATSETPPSSLIGKLVEAVSALELMQWSWNKEASRGVGRAAENVWCRAWRRKKLHALSEDEQTQQLPEDYKLGFAVTVEVGRQETVVSLHWLEGHDQAIFESLGGYLQGKLRTIMSKR
ncbi:hypothetical protein OQA88_10884 [Cercophora sp. LCS_1]